jgi:hypothetical protein
MEKLEAPFLYGIAIDPEMHCFLYNCGFYKSLRRKSE